MYQFTIAIGNVGRDPEIRYTPAGKPVADFSLAVNKKWTDGNGEPREKTTWYRVSCWGPLAEAVNTHVHKGMLLMATGEVEASAWVGQDGKAMATLELNARDIKFLSRKNGQENPAKPEETLTDIPF